MNLIALLPRLSQWLVPNKPVWTSLTFMAGALWAALEMLDGSAGLAAFPEAVRATIHALHAWFQEHATWLIMLGVAKRFSSTNGAATPPSTEAAPPQPK